MGCLLAFLIAGGLPGQNPAANPALDIPRKAFVDAVIKAKPNGSKGTYLKKVSLSSTMGPGVKIDTAELGA